MEDSVEMEIDNTNQNLIREQQMTFGTVEKMFRDEISNHPRYEQNTVICCDEEHENELIQLAHRIKLTQPYNDLSDRDLYLTLIFIYYSLLGEQTEDVFTLDFLKKKSINKPLVEQLYLQLTTGDIIETNGRNLSQDVRRGFLGFSPIGGKPKNKTKKKNKKKKKKNKKKTTKTRKLVRRYSHKRHK
jgi:hypothetical protein